MAQAQVTISFDDQGYQEDPFFTTPIDYHGYSFSGLQVFQWNSDAHSGQFAANTFFGSNLITMRKTGGGLFNLLDGFFKTTPGGTFYDVAVGYRNGTVIYTQDLPVDDTMWRPYTLNFGGVDRVDFYNSTASPGSSASALVVMDDLRVASTTAPEPASVALVAGGLLALGGVALRRRKAMA